MRCHGNSKNSGMHQRSSSHYYLIVSAAIISIPVVSLIIPDWIAQRVLTLSFIESFLTYLPKYSKDALSISQYDRTISTKYIMSMLLSLPVFVTIMAYGMYRASRFSPSPEDLPLYLKRSSVKHFILILAVLIYIAFFDTWIVGADTRIARKLFRSPLCVAYLPLLFGVITIGAIRLTETVRAIKLDLLRN